MGMRPDESAALPSALAANTRRILPEKSTPVAVTTQKGIDGHREKAMRIACVEHVELGMSVVTLKDEEAHPCWFKTVWLKAQDFSFAVMGWSWETCPDVDAGGMALCRFGEVCWRPLCPYHQNGKG